MSVTGKNDNCQGADARADGLTAHLTLDISSMPELIWSLRRELADLIRAEAEGEPAFVAARLLRIADMFEAGMSDAEGRADG